MRFTKLRLLTLAATLLSVLGLVIGASIAASSPASASTTRDFLVTLYGWPDNSPPGNAIAYPKNGGSPTDHDGAGGVGTYADPVTFATDSAELPVGTIVYYSYLHRYFIMEDDCTECDEDWAGQGPDGGPHMYHIDLWIGGRGGDSNAVIDCEDNLTQSSASVVVDPPNDEPVDTTPLFKSSDNACYNPSSFKGTGTGAGSGSGTPSGRATPSAGKKTTAPPGKASPSAASSASGATKTHTGGTNTAPSTTAAAKPSGGNGSAGTSSSSPATGAGARYTGIAGPGCANSSAARFVGVGFSGGGSDDWLVDNYADGTGSGCSINFPSMPMSGKANQDAENRGLWIFNVSPSAAPADTCTLRVYVPKPDEEADDYAVDGTDATYEVFEGTTTQDSSQIGEFTLNQTGMRGGSALETGFSTNKPLLIVRLMDRGIDYNTTPNAMYGVAAVRATCSAS